MLAVFQAQFISLAFVSRFGGWVVDGFPLTREHWTAMFDANLLPDFVLSLEDEGAPGNYLQTRFAQLHGLADPTPQKAAPAEEEAPPQEGEGEKVVLRPVADAYNH